MLTKSPEELIEMARAEGLLTPEDEEELARRKARFHRLLAKQAFEAILDNDVENKMIMLGQLSEHLSPKDLADLGPAQVKKLLRLILEDEEADDSKSE